MSQIVLIHGLCGSKDYFEELSPQLNAEVHLLTLPGHDGSEAGPKTMEEFADYVIKEIQSRNLNRPIVLGHSFGGYIVTNLVRRYADEISAFGLIHSTAAADSEEAKAKRDVAISKVNAEGVPKFIDAMIPGVFASDSNASLIERAKQIGYKTSKEGVVCAQAAIRDRQDETETVHATHLPGIFIYGEKDPNMDSKRAFQGADKHTKQVVMASHMGMMELPDLEAKLINEWIELEVQDV